MLNCKRISELISKKLDRQLTFFEKFSLKFHKMMCPDCTQFENESNIISETIKKSNSSNSVMSAEKKKALHEALSANS